MTMMWIILAFLLGGATGMAVMALAMAAGHADDAR